MSLFFPWEAGKQKRKEKLKHEPSTTSQSSVKLAQEASEKKKRRKDWEHFELVPSAQVTKHKGEKLSYFERKRKNE